ncbi:MAG: ATP synthase F0 subunit C [Candidatus Binatia bacterium]
MRKGAVFVLMITVALGSAALAGAAAEGTAAPGATDSLAKAAIALGAGLAIAIAAFGAALGQGRMAAAAMESIGRNPNAADRIQLPMILGLAFIEALALYGFVIAFFLQGKI